MKKVEQAIGEELKAFEQIFKESLKTRNPLLQRILRFIINQKGKQMRPMFVLLSAKISGEINEATYRAAGLIELLHTATLVHDDVVDNAMMRRNFFSLNALWKNKIAVLVGDYLLGRGLLLSIEHEDFALLKITSQAVKDMSEGEILQMEKSRKLDITEGVYYEIIKAKTASLLAAACSAGAYSSTSDSEVSSFFKTFGMHVGTAFQIKDDLFDYGETQIGKPTGIDIKEKKMTLPLIYTLQHAEKDIKRKIIYLVKNKSTDRESVNWIINEVKKTGGITYAEQQMHQYQQKALEMLHTYPDSLARQALEEMVNYVINRKY